MTQVFTMVGVLGMVVLVVLVVVVLLLLVATEEVILMVAHEPLVVGVVGHGWPCWHHCGTRPRPFYNGSFIPEQGCTQVKDCLLLHVRIVHGGLGIGISSRRLGPMTHLVIGTPLAATMHMVCELMDSYLLLPHIATCFGCPRCGYGMHQCPPFASVDDQTAC